MTNYFRTTSFSITEENTLLIPKGNLEFKVHNLHIIYRMRLYRLTRSYVDAFRD